METDRAYLKHILEAIELIERYSAGITYENLIDKTIESNKTRDAIVREFEIIGEASNKLTSNTRERDTSIQWRAVVGMRNKLSHEYFGVDYEIIWKAITENLPKLKIAVTKLLKSL